MKAIVTAAVLLMLVLVACKADTIIDTPIINEPMPVNSLLEVSFSLGDKPSATAQWHGSDSLATQSLVDDITDSDIDLLPTGPTASALSVTNITHGGMRYISASFEFTNNTGAALTDIYFIPVDTDNTFAGTETLDSSEFASLVDFSNTPISTLPTGMTSATAKVYDPISNMVVDASYNDFMTPLVVGGLPAQTGLSYKAYGFLAHNNDRSSTTITDAGNGRITVAAQLTSGASDPFAFSMMFEVVRDQPLVASDDTFNVTGNVGLNVTSLGSVLLNDLGGTPTSVTFGNTLASATGTVANGTNTVITTNGGIVLLNADGTFTYDPPAGYAGNDSFYYGSAIGAESDTAEVALNVAGMVWFIDNSATTSTNKGTLANPFKTIADFNTANTGAAPAPQPNHDIYLAETGTDYAAGITLRDGQRLIAEGATGTDLETLLGLTLPSFSKALPAINGTKPSITNAAGNGVNLGSGNTIRGLNVGTTSAMAIKSAGMLSAGNLTISDVSVNGTGGIINIDGGTLNVNLDSATGSGGTKGIVLNNVDGSFTVAGAVNFSNTTGEIIDITNNPTNALALNFQGAVVLDNKTIANTGAGVSLTNSAATTLTFSGGLDIDTNTGIGMNSTGGTVNVSGASNFIDATNLALNMSNTALNMTFANVNATNSPTQSLLLNDNTGSLVINAGTLLPLNGNAAVQISGGSLNTTINTDMQQFTNGPVVNIIGGHTGTSNFSGGTITAFIGTGLQFDNADGSYNFNGTTTLNGGDAGIDILNGSSGTFTFGTGTAITSPSGIAFNATNSAANVTYSGSITQNNAATGINLFSNTSGTFTFNGSMALSTGLATAFNASSGGTVNVTGTNTVTTTTGTAINVTNTTIGASNLTFQSVSSNGASSGIVLSNTGSTGGLVVSGDGTTTRNASGGTIQNNTASGIILTNTSNIDLNHLNITNAGIHAVDGTGVTNFNIRHGTISGIGPAAVDDHNALNFITGAQSLTGTVLIDNVAFTNFEDTGIDILNSSGTANVTVSNSAFSSNQMTFGNEAIAIESTGTARFNLDVTNNTFTNLQGDAVGARVGGSGGTHDFNITGNNSTNSLSIGGGDFLIQMTNGRNITFDIASNTVDHASLLLSGDPIQIVGDGNAEGRIIGNTLSGYGGDAIRLDMGGSNIASAGNITWTVLIQNNTIGVSGNAADSRSASADEGIDLLSRDHGGTLNLTIDNNNIHNPISRAINLFSDEDSPSATGPTNNISIINSTFTGVPGDSIRIRNTDSPIATCAHISGNTGSGAILLDEDTTPLGSSIEITQASLAALAAANSGMTVFQNDGVISFNGGCTNPTLPMNP